MTSMATWVASQLLYIRKAINPKFKIKRTKILQSTSINYKMTTTLHKIGHSCNQKNQKGPFKLTTWPKFSRLASESCLNSSPLRLRFQRQTQRYLCMGSQRRQHMKCFAHFGQFNQTSFALSVTCPPEYVKRSCKGRDLCFWYKFQFNIMNHESRESSM